MARKKVLVIGDLSYEEILHLSPVSALYAPDYQVIGEEMVLTGAARIAGNLAAQDCEVCLLTSLGYADSSSRALKMLNSMGVVVEGPVSKVPFFHSRTCLKLSDKTVVTYERSPVDGCSAEATGGAISAEVYESLRCLLPEVSALVVAPDSGRVMSSRAAEMIAMKVDAPLLFSVAAVVSEAAVAKADCAVVFSNNWTKKFFGDFSGGFENWVWFSEDYQEIAGQGGFVDSFGDPYESSKLLRPVPAFDVFIAVMTAAKARGESLECAVGLAHAAAKTIGNSKTGDFLSLEDLYLRGVLPPQAKLASEDEILRRSKAFKDKGMPMVLVDPPTVMSAAWWSKLADNLPRPASHDKLVVVAELPYTAEQVKLRTAELPYVDAVFCRDDEELTGHFLSRFKPDWLITANPSFDEGLASYVLSHGGAVKVVCL
jgi:hypothetical protein